MTDLPGFAVDIDHNPYLPPGGREVSAIITVAADGGGDSAPPSVPGRGDSAEIIIIDCSGSMDSPPDKMAQARTATAAAVDVVDEGAWFAVVAGTTKAWPVYPPDGSMAIAGARTKADAKSALRGLRAGGGTAIGQWLRLAHQVFASSPAVLRHVILLTDGKNEYEKPKELAAAIRLCEGEFRCDCRGIGTDWQVKELREISTALLGTVDIVDLADLAADFRQLMHGAMSKRLPDVLLRVWTPRHASVKFVKQVAPGIDDLTGRRVESTPQQGDYPTGAWAPGEARDYHVGIAVSPALVRQRMLAARISLVASSADGERMFGEGEIQVTWTDDEALSTRINSRVAIYIDQADLAAAIQEGLEAKQRGDEETATARLGRAVALAREAGNEEMRRLLAKIVDVIDEEEGTVRLKRTVNAADEMALDARSFKTVRVTKG